MSVGTQQVKNPLINRISVKTSYHKVSQLEQVRKLYQNEKNDEWKYSL